MNYHSGTAILNLAHLASGMYTLSVIFENGDRMLRKVVKP
jgi:hypothetical protein